MLSCLAVLQSCTVMLMQGFGSMSLACMPAHVDNMEACNAGGIACKGKNVQTGACMKAAGMQVEAAQGMATNCEADSIDGNAGAYLHPFQVRKLDLQLPEVLKTADLQYACSALDDACLQNNPER